jgi:tripartite-type tricarboxylate transporter receptor subunit TctC
MFRQLSCAVALVLCCAAAQGQDFPSRPITIIVASPPGGLIDASARMVAEPLTRLLKQPVVAENRPGSSGNLAAQAVARAEPDGYTLLATTGAYHVGNPLLMKDLPWALKDFAPVAMITVATNVVAIHPSLPVNSLQELVAYLKKNPDKVNYASQGNGSVAHIAAELFKLQTGTKMTHVPYKGSGQAIQDLLAGQVQLFITTPPSVMQYVQTGKLKALAITGQSRHPMLPNVPTAAEAGVPGLELEAWVALFAPAGTKPAVVGKLADAIKQALDLPETRQRIAAQGIEIRYLPPEALARQVDKDYAYWGDVIRKANIKLD